MQLRTDHPSTRHERHRSHHSITAHRRRHRSLDDAWPGLARRAAPRTRRPVGASAAAAGSTTGRRSWTDPTARPGARYNQRRSHRTLRDIVACAQDGSPLRREVVGAGWLRHGQRRRLSRRSPVVPKGAGVDHTAFLEAPEDWTAVADSTVKSWSRCWSRRWGRVVLVREEIIVSPSSSDVLIKAVRSTRVGSRMGVSCAPGTRAAIASLMASP